MDMKTTKTAPAARYFDASSAPANPWTGAREAGWYFSDATGEWTLCYGGQAEAEHYARMAREGAGVR